MTQTSTTVVAKSTTDLLAAAEVNNMNTVINANSTDAESRVATLEAQVALISIPDLFSGGIMDYNDAATAGTPIVVTGGGGAVVLTNDEAGAFTNKTYKPVGVTDVWDSINDTFDWSDLKLGDMVDIRIDVDLTTTSVNTEVKIDLELGTGGFAYTIPWILETNYKNTGTHKLNRYNGVYMGDTNTLNNGAVFKISADKNCTVVVNGWYCKIIVRG
jgi:hypothetical protein